MRLYAGFDGGGSKTACCLCDETGALLGTGLGGSSNYLFERKEEAARAMKGSLAAAFSTAGLALQPLTGAFVGSAAILLGHGDAHLPFFESCIPAAQLYCDSDILPVWFGGTGGKPGVVAIAGTGSIAYGCTEQGFFRVGGWGPQLGDEGSGYDLGHRALQTAARMADGRIPTEPAFLNRILRFYDVKNAHDLIFAVKGENARQKIAACAKAVFELENNPVADRLLEETAEELALLCRTAARKAGREDLPVILSGGLAAPILPRLTQKLPRVALLQVSPALSCAALALEKAGHHTAALRLLEEGCSC